MGQRGPLRVPTSVRGERERRKRAVTRTEKPATCPAMPDWLPKPARPQWAQTVADLEAAGVVLEAADSQAIAMYVLSVHEAQIAANLADQAGSDRDRLAYLAKAARFGRDALQWGQQIGATPAARARMNVKPPKPSDDDNPWARFD